MELWLAALIILGVAALTREAADRYAAESQRRQAHVEPPAVNSLEQLHRLPLGAAHLEAGDQVKNSRFLCLPNYTRPCLGKLHTRNVNA